MGIQASSLYTSCCCPHTPSMCTTQWHPNFYLVAPSTVVGTLLRLLPDSPICVVRDIPYTRRNPV